MNASLSSFVQFMNPTSPKRRNYGSFATGPLDQRLLLSMRVASDRITELENDKRELIKSVDTLEDQLISEQMVTIHKEWYWKYIAVGVTLALAALSLAGCATPTYQSPNESPVWVEARTRWIAKEMREATKDVVFYPIK